MTTKTPAQLTENDQLPEYGGTIARVAHRPGGIVEIWFREDHLSPLGFRPEYQPEIEVTR